MYFSRSAVGTVQNGTKLLSGGSLFRARGDDHVDEEAMDAPVVGKFRVEGGSQDVFLADENRGVVALGEHLDAGADLEQARGADEDHLQRAARQGSFRGEDG